MMIQVNIRLPDEIVDELDRWGAEDGLERSGCVKKITIRAVEARLDGRTMYEPPEMPGPADLQRLVVALTQSTMEMHRIATDWAEHGSEMHQQKRDDQLAMTRARTEFIAGMPERIGASLNPIRVEMAAMARAIETQPRLDEINAHGKQTTDAITAIRAELNQLRKEPRKVFGVVLGDGRFWSTAFIAAWSMAMFAVGFMFMAPLGATFPSIGVPLSHKMMMGDAEFCRLVDYRFERNDCQVPRAHRLEAEPTGSSAKGAPAKGRGR